MKFGGEVRTVRFYTDRVGGITYTYANLSDFLQNKLTNFRYTGNLSDPSVFNNNATGQREGAQAYYIAYAQDEWRISSKFVLNYGMRYEYYAPVHEVNNLNVQFDINCKSVPNCFLPTDHSFYQGVKTNFGPRFGATYSPAAKTAIRAGVGIFYGPGQTEDLLQPIESDLINTVVSSNLTGFPVDVNAVRTNFITNASNRSFTPRAYSPDYQVPERVYQYNVSVQQEFPGKFVLTGAYVGSQGRNLFLRSIANQITSVRTDPVAGAVVIRQFDIDNGGTSVSRPFGEIDYKTSGGHDSYNAMQLSLVRRSPRGLTMNAQYTLGRSYGNSEGSNEADTVGNNATAIKDFDYDNGYNKFDIRHNFNVSLVYGIPSGKLSGFAKTLFGNWEIGSIANARSGLPVNVVMNRPDIVYQDSTGAYFSSFAAGRTAVINVPGGGSTRATRERVDLIPGVDPYLNGDRTLFNPAAFAVPKPGTFGNIPRNYLRGPHFRQVDLILNKKFPIAETRNIEFRTEVFNVFNLTNFAAPASLLAATLGTASGQFQPGAPLSFSGNSTFGLETSTVERSVGLGTNRQIQFALRINF